MFQTIELFMEVLQFLNENEIVNLYNSNDTLYSDLFKAIKYQYPDFKITFHRVIQFTFVKWFKKKNISIKLFEECKINKHWGEQWFLNGQLHRDNDLPAVI